MHITSVNLITKDVEIPNEKVWTLQAALQAWKKIWNHVISCGLVVKANSLPGNDNNIMHAGISIKTS